MALTKDSFKRPQGRLNPAWYEGGDLDDMLEAWLAEAQAKTSSEPAQEAWVYHRAFQALADDRLLQPATVAADDIREAYAPEQLAMWRRWADEYRARYDALTNGGAAAPVITPVRFHK